MCRSQHCAQFRNEQRLIHVLLHALNVEDGQVGIERRHLRAHRADHGSAYFETSAAATHRIAANIQSEIAQ
jgi:hypothetical protein